MPLYCQRCSAITRSSHTIPSFLIIAQRIESKKSGKPNCLHQAQLKSTNPFIRIYYQRCQTHLPNSSPRLRIFCIRKFVLSQANHCIFQYMFIINQAMLRITYRLIEQLIIIALIITQSEQEHSRSPFLTEISHYYQNQLQMQSGTLIVKCVSAKLTRNTEFLGKMDPYVKITIKGQEQKTRVHNNAGKTPRWDQQLRFKVQPGRDDEMRVAVYDEDVTSDDLVGETTYFLDEVFQKGKVVENGVTIAYKGKPAGQVAQVIELEFFKEGGMMASQVGQQMIHQIPVAAPYMQQQPMAPAGYPMQQPNFLYGQMQQAMPQFMQANYGYSYMPPASQPVYPGIPMNPTQPYGQMPPQTYPQQAYPQPQQAYPQPPQAYPPQPYGQQPPLGGAPQGHPSQYQQQPTTQQQQPYGQQCPPQSQPPKVYPPPTQPGASYQQSQPVSTYPPQSQGYQPVAQGYPPNPPPGYPPPASATQMPYNYNYTEHK